MIYSLAERRVQLEGECYVAPSATLIGSVVIGHQASIWFNVTIRGDNDVITIGAGSNIQDGSVLHVTHRGEFSPEGAELHIGDRVTVGHKVLLHGCRIGNRCLIGMGSIITDNAIVEDQVMIGSGTLVPPGKVLESGFLYLGNPVQQKRRLSERELEYFDYVAEHYVRLKERY